MSVAKIGKFKPCSVALIKNVSMIALKVDVDDLMGRKTCLRKNSWTG